MSDFGIDLHWIREDNYNDSLERQKEQESDEIACWLDSASVREIIQVWGDIDVYADLTTDDVITMVWNGEDAKAWLKQRIQELAEKQFDTWKHSSKLAYKACK